MQWFWAARVGGAATSSDRTLTKLIRIDILQQAWHDRGRMGIALVLQWFRSESAEARRFTSVQSVE